MANNDYGKGFITFSNLSLFVESSLSVFSLQILKQALEVHI